MSRDKLVRPEPYYDIVVIGGVAAGMSAASQARRTNQNCSIALFERNEYFSYAAGGIPYYINKEISDIKQLIMIDEEQYRDQRGIQLFKKAEVKHIDFKNKSLDVQILSNKPESILVGYDKLIIATGADPIRPPIPGINNNQTFVLRNIHHGILISQFIDNHNPKKVIIIGGGFVALEILESFREKNITILILEKQPFISSPLDKEIRNIVQDYLQTKTIQVVTSANITRIKQQNKTLLVEYNQTTVECDCIIVCAGVKPNTDFLKDSPLKRTPDGAIIVDEHSRTNLIDVYAAGDCATVKNIITKQDVYVPMASTANKQGRVAGQQAAGKKSETFPGVLGTQLIKVFDLEIGKTGLNEREASELGIKTQHATVDWRSKGDFFPQEPKTTVKILINKETRQMIGGQLAGYNGTSHRINVLATAIASKMTIDQFAYLDLGNYPSIAPVWDSLLVAAHELKNQ